MSNVFDLRQLERVMEGGKCSVHLTVLIDGVEYKEDVFYGLAMRLAKTPDEELVEVIRAITMCYQPIITQLVKNNMEAESIVD